MACIERRKEMAKSKPKIGMYGETPRVQIGKFTICEMHLPPGKSIWIEEEGEDGMEFPKDHFEKFLKQWYDTNF
jgi:hypothetical protein